MMHIPDLITELKERRGHVYEFCSPITLSILVLAYLLIFTSIVLSQYNSFWFGAFDLGIFDQGTWLLSQGKNPFVTVRGLHLFGDHASYIQIFIAPLYWLGDNAGVLLIAQSLILTLGAVPVYLIANEKFRDGWSPLIFTLSYLMYPALNFIIIEGYHPVCLAVTFILFSYYFLIKKRYNLFFISAFLALICKETIAPTFILFGVYIFFTHDKKIGAATYISSITWLLLVITLFQPYFNGVGNVYLDRSFGSFGDTPQDILTSLFNPGFMYNKVVTSENARYTSDLLMPVSFLPLLDLRSLLLSASYFMNVLTDWPYAHSITYHYTAPVIPFVFISIINGVARFRKRGRALLLSLLVLSAIAGNLCLGPDQTKLTQYYANIQGFNKMNPYSREVITVMELIPKNASVSASYNYVPHLSHREGIYMYPNPFKSSNYGIKGKGFIPHKEVDYILLDPELPDVKERRQVMEGLLSEGRYTLVLKRRRVLLYAKA